MSMLPVIFLVSFLGGSSCTTTVYIPTGTSSPRLGSTVVLNELKYKQEIYDDRTMTDKVVTPLNTYTETIRIIEGPVDTSEVMGISQPASMLLSTGMADIGGTIQSFLEKDYDTTKAIEVMFYAEKLSKREAIPDTFQPDDKWEDNFRFRDTTHYVKEILHGSIYSCLFTVVPTGNNKLNDIKQKIKDILEEASTTSSPVDGIGMILETLQGQILIPSVQFTTLGYSGYMGDLRDVKERLDIFRASKSYTEIKYGLKPLMEFNPKKKEFIMSYDVDELSPYMDMIEVMYNDIKKTESMMSKYNNYDNYDKLKLNLKLYNELADQLPPVRNEFYPVFLFNFHQGGEQFLPAFKAYKHRAGYYQARWKEVLQQIELGVKVERKPLGEIITDLTQGQEDANTRMDVLEKKLDQMKKEKERMSNDGDDLSTSRKVVKKVNQIMKQVKHLIPGDHFTVKLNSAVSGKRTVVFPKLLSGHGKLYDVTTGLMSAQNKGVYHITYSLQKSSIRKTVIKIMKDDVTLAEGTSDDGRSCVKNDCSQVISGSFTTTLLKGDNVKVELVEGKLGSNSYFSATFLRGID